MTIWILSLLAVNIFLGLAVGVLWIRMVRPPKEDPRLSRGLQLLQSKITVLEDLSDRTDIQVRQLVAILDERAKGLQSKLFKAEETLMKIEGSMAKSLDVAKIFQDKIPHEEIIERNQTSKYVLAAKLAHEGKSVQEIVEQVGLPESEVEFIAKVNRDELSFNPELLPEWAKVSEITTPDLSGLEMVENNFKQAVRVYEEQERQEQARIQAIDDRANEIRQNAFQMAETIATQAAKAATATASGAVAAMQAASHVAGQATQVAGQVAGQVATQAAQKAQQAGQYASQAYQKAEPVIRKVQFPRIKVDKTP